jgi:hypothetical protein
MPKKWTPLRREAERLLADGAWHEDQVLFCQLARFVDPRMAARHWFMEYRRNGQRHHQHDVEERLPAAEAWRRSQPRALQVGVHGAYVQRMHTLVKMGRVETEVWNGRRRYRLKPVQT